MHIKKHPHSNYMQHHALYIGAGSDTIPLVHCHWIQRFTCIDSQPYSEYGILQSGRIDAYGNDEYARPDFLQDLDHAYIQAGFHLTGMGRDTMRCYSNQNKHVFYYYNTSIPDHHSIMKLAFKDIDTIVVSGHDPDCIFLNYTTKRLMFIGVEGTSFDAHEGSNGLITSFHKGKNQFFFRSYLFLHQNGETKEFPFWDEFLNYYDDVNHCRDRFTSSRNGDLF